VKVPSDNEFSIQNISISFGGLKAVSGFSLTLPSEQLCGLIGPNGAGKTTIFNLITGVYPPDTGNLFLAGTNITHLPPFEIAQNGIARTFQNIRLLSDLSVVDNVLISYHMRSPYGIWDAILRTKKYNEKENELREKARSLLDLMGLLKRESDRAGSLSYGDQRRLEIARALATGPKVLLLDEPAAGLNSQEKVLLMNTISEIRKRFRITILLIEHDMKLVMGICERITVIDYGHKTQAK
jgi:branched-chain amino acid transport system ATP-binding protein